MKLLRNWGVPLFCLSVLVWPAWGATQVFFTSQESVETEMVRLIEQAHSSIDLALYEFRSANLADAVRRAKARGVRVRVVLDSSRREQDLVAGEVRWLGGKHEGGRGIMHHKFVLFDQDRVVTGSFNWTPGAEHANYENALLIDDANTVQAYAGEFETLWRRASEGPPPGGNPPYSKVWFSNFLRSKT